MLEGVRILIERMEVAPEDFIYDNDRSLHVGIGSTPKFHHITSKLDNILAGGATDYNIFSHLTAEEKTALLVAYRKMMRQHFTAHVIARTFAEKEAPEIESKAMQANFGARSAGKSPSLGAGFGNAIAKAEGAHVQYFSSDGLQILSDRERIGKEIEAQMREHARLEAAKVKAQLCK